jgi:hypothetical protein
VGTGMRRLQQIVTVLHQSPTRPSALGDLRCSIHGGHCPTGDCRGTQHDMQSVPGCRYRVRPRRCGCPGSCRISGQQSAATVDLDVRRIEIQAASPPAGTSIESMSVNGESLVSVALV